MNEGWLALGLLVLFILALGWIALHREVIFSQPATPAKKTAALKPVRRLKNPPALVERSSGRAGETEPKQAEAVSSDVSGSTTGNDVSETVSLETIAKLVRAKKLTQTDGIEIAFDVKAGSSTRYTHLRDRLREVLKDMPAVER